MWDFGRYAKFCVLTVFQFLIRHHNLTALGCFDRRKWSFETQYICWDELTYVFYENGDLKRKTQRSSLDGEKWYIFYLEEYAYSNESETRSGDDVSNDNVRKSNTIVFAHSGAISIITEMPLRHSFLTWPVAKSSSKRCRWAKAESTFPAVTFTLSKSEKNRSKFLSDEFKHIGRFYKNLPGRRIRQVFFILIF